MSQIDKFLKNKEVDQTLGWPCIFREEVSTEAWRWVWLLQWTRSLLCDPVYWSSSRTSDQMFLSLFV